MKRIPELHGLSADHHHGLVLARRLRQAAAGTGKLSVEQAWGEAEREFERELKPHFRIEEEILAPALEDIGESGLVDRMRRDHEQLRSALAPSSDRSAASLDQFGEMLERHIRFEETRLFAAAQDRLTQETLQAVAKASNDEKRTR